MDVLWLLHFSEQKVDANRLHLDTCLTRLTNKTGNGMWCILLWCIYFCFYVFIFLLCMWCIYFLCDENSYIIIDKKIGYSTCCFLQYFKMKIVSYNYWKQFSSYKFFTTNTLQNLIYVTLHVAHGYGKNNIYSNGRLSSFYVFVLCLMPFFF